MAEVVKTNCINATSFQFQTFLSELYVYLVDQMHIGLNKVLLVEDQAPVPEPLTDSAQLKHFAREAEVNENYEMAAKYYQEVCHPLIVFVRRGGADWCVRCCVFHWFFV